MICKSIEAYSLRYLENEFSARESRRFIKHLRLCSRCRSMYCMISANYNTEEKVLELGQPLSERISSLIDKSRYSGREKLRKPLSLKKVFIVAIVSVLLVFTVANAGTILKTYEELKNAMFIDQNIMNIKGTKHTGIYSDEDYVKSVYEKYEEDVQTQIDRMENAENAILTFKEENKDFYVQIAKGFKGNFITYGFDGYSNFQNEYHENFLRKMFESRYTGLTEYDSIEELLKAVDFAPIPGYIPEGYSLESACHSNVSKGSTMPQHLGLYYRNNDGEWLNIGLTNSKMAADNIGIPEELLQAANLSMPQVEADTEGENAIPEEIMEEIKVGKYQAVYIEKPVFSTTTDGTYNIIKTINIYLGDNVRLPILRIDSGSLDKKTLIKVASQVEILNIDRNLIETEDYFQGIEDTKILSYTDEFLEKVKSGQTDFKLKIDTDTEFYRYSHNDTYYITYRNVSLDKSQSMVPLSIRLDESMLENFEHATVQILGRPYTNTKTYSLHFIREGETALGIYIDKPVKLPDDIDFTDYIVSIMRGVKCEAKPLFSGTGHLYYLIDTGPRSWILQTGYLDNGIVRSCRFNINKEILADVEAVTEFVNGL